MMEPAGISIQSGADGTLLVSGELSIACAGELRQALAFTLGAGGNAAVDLSALSADDLSGLQLLYSARQTWRRAGRRLLLQGTLASLCEMAEKAGCKPLPGEDTEEGCG